MLPKNFRLKNKKDFDRVHKLGKFYRDKFIALKVKPNKLPDTRIGIIVGTKISKKAVMRNKIKRRIRAGLIEIIDKIKPGFDIVIMVRPEIIEKEYQEIFLSLKKLFSLAHLIDKNG